MNEGVSAYTITSEHVAAGIDLTRRTLTALYESQDGRGGDGATAHGVGAGEHRRGRVSAGKDGRFWMALASVAVGVVCLAFVSVSGAGLGGSDFHDWLNVLRVIGYGVLVPACAMLAIHRWNMRRYRSVVFFVSLSVFFFCVLVANSLYAVGWDEAVRLALAMTTPAVLMVVASLLFLLRRNNE